MNNFNSDSNYLPPFSPNPSHHLITFPSSSSSSHPTTNIPNNPRKKKRTKLMHIGDTHDTLLYKPKHVREKYQEHYNMHKNEDIPPCTECGKRFSSQKALYGHMRCHPERQWRGINPPRNIRRPVIGKSLHDEMSDEEHEVATYLLMLASGVGLSESSVICSDNLHGHATLEGEAHEAVGGTSSLHCGRFECSSCKKVFGSHQALGGHRATHKNVKGCFAITRSDGVEYEEINNGLRIWDAGGERNSTSIVGEGGHRCDICLKVFSSGQALGGHKRCHWEKVDEVVVNPIVRNLDLNLPAQNTTADQECSSSGLSLELKLGL